MSNCNTIDDKVIDNCMEIINQETKPLKKKPSNKAMVCNNIRIKRDRMEHARLTLACNTSELMEIGKEFD